jgi:hypothetical protein
MKAFPLAGAVDLYLGPARQPLPVYVGMLVVACVGLALSIVQYLRSVAVEPVEMPAVEPPVPRARDRVCIRCQQQILAEHRVKYEGEIGRRYNRDGSVSIEFD